MAGDNFHQVTSLKEQIGVYSTYHVDGIVGGRKRSFERFHYTFYVEQCVVEFCDELKLDGVGRFFYVVTGKILQHVRHR